MRLMNDFGPVLVFLFICLACLLGLAYCSENATCSATAMQMNVPHQYGMWTDCMIWSKGHWIPLKAYRDIN